MSRLRRTAVTIIVILLVVGGLGYLAHTLDLVGLIVRMHTPPQH